MIRHAFAIDPRCTVVGRGFYYGGEGVMPLGGGAEVWSGFQQVRGREQGGEGLGEGGRTVGGRTIGGRTVGGGQGDRSGSGSLKIQPSPNVGARGELEERPIHHIRICLEPERLCRRKPVNRNNADTGATHLAGAPIVCGRAGGLRLG